jgi:hypothetical protein
MGCNTVVASLRSAHFAAKAYHAAPHLRIKTKKSNKQLFPTAQFNWGTRGAGERWGGTTFAAKPTVAAASGWQIKTSKDAVAVSVAIPTVGAVTATAASALTLNPVAATADQTATISFTTSTALATNESIVLMFPGTGHVTTLANNKCGISSPAGKTTTSAMAAGPPHTITLTLAASNTLAAGAVTVTCGGI